MLCPSCGTKNNYYHRFCFQCGASLLSEKAEASQEHSIEKSKVKDHEIKPFIIEPIVPEEVDDSEAAYDDNNPKFDAKVPEDYFDISRQIPLKRYQKETDDNNNSLHVLLKICISLVFIALLGFIGFIGYDQLIKGSKPSANVLLPIDFQSEIIAVVEENQPARKIIIHTQRGEQVRMLDRLFPVINDRAEILVTDSELYLQDHTINKEKLDIRLPITIIADGYPNKVDVVSFSIPIPYAPLSIHQPADGHAVITGTSYTLSMEVRPDSLVWVNDSSYSHLIDNDGYLNVKLNIPNEPENNYIIKVTTAGFADTVREVVINRAQMPFPLSISQSNPIKATDDWVTITGKTDPQAILTSNLEMQSEPVIDSATGDFSLTVKAVYQGYTPFVLTAKLEGNDNSVLQLVIDKNSIESTYTSMAWALPYDELKNYPNLHNGRTFVFSGRIVDILESGDKNVFIVNSGTESQEQLMYVEHWGTFNYTKGQSIRVFGNRWGNNNGMPRILGRYLYLQR